MVRIRLNLTGKKNAPSYRVAAIDSRNKRDGRALEILGYYNPQYNPPEFKLDQKRYEYWLSVGAQPSQAVIKLVAGEYTFQPYAGQSKDEKPPEEEAPEEETATEESAKE